MVRVGKSSVGKGRSGTKILRQEWAWVWKKNMKLEGRCRQVRWCVSSQAMPKKNLDFYSGRTRKPWRVFSKRLEGC